MTIKGSNGESYDVTGSGQGLYNTIAGSIGALGALGGNGGFLNGLFGGNGAHQVCSENQPINRYEAQQMDQLAAKDAEIARLMSEKSTDQKLVEVYRELAAKDNAMRDRVDAMGKELGEKITIERESRLVAEKEQAVFNQSVTGGMATVKQQIQTLNTIVGEITTNVVPQSKVCNTCNCCCN